MKNMMLLVLMILVVGCAQVTAEEALTPTNPPTSVLVDTVATETKAVTSTSEAAASTATLPAITSPTATLALETPVPTLNATPCDLQPLVVPTLPAVIPGSNRLDESIGLHVTGHYQVLDVESYRLKISGLVETPLELTYDQLRCMPRETIDQLLVCLGVFEDEATWTGVPLSYVLDLAGGMQAGVKEIVLISADGYKTSVSWKEGLIDRNLLAYEVNGEVLPILHGFPLRAVIVSENGDKWVKWLVEIQVN